MCARLWPSGHTGLATRARPLIAIARPNGQSAPNRDGRAARRPHGARTRVCASVAACVRAPPGRARGTPRSALIGHVRPLGAHGFARPTTPATACVRGTREHSAGTPRGCPRGRCAAPRRAASRGSLDTAARWLAYTATGELNPWPHRHAPRPSRTYLWPGLGRGRQSASRASNPRYTLLAVSETPTRQVRGRYPRHAATDRFGLSVQGLPLRGLVTATVRLRQHRYWPFSCHAPDGATVGPLAFWTCAFRRHAPCGHGMTVLRPRSRSGPLRVRRPRRFGPAPHVSCCGHRVIKVSICTSVISDARVTRGCVGGGSDRRKPPNGYFGP
jgi:hypothetical protein